MTIAPIVLFVFNRLLHTKQTINALLKNDLAAESELYIFSDGAKNDQTIVQVIDVRNYIKSIIGFKSITICLRDSNWGLARNIIDGVTQIITKHGKVIVLEDDLVISSQFLRFMNTALDYYSNQLKVWHISGWSYSIDQTSLEDAFLWRVMNCSGGWATWQNRWKYFKKEPRELLKTFSHKEIRKFNLDNRYCFWNQIVQNVNGTLNTWAIFWYATIFKNNGLCLNPTITFVNNIGFDGTGENSDVNNYYTSKALNEKQEYKFPTNLVESEIAVERVKVFYHSLKKPLLRRVLNRLMRGLSSKLRLKLY